MNMSHRLTLSFLSIFLLLALVAVPVMAHDDTITPTTNEAAHTHPLLETVDADASATPPTDQVTAHGHHPRVTSIVLKGDADKVRDEMVVVGAIPTAGQTATAGTIDPNEFVLIVTFDRPVVDAAATTLPADAATADADASAVLAVTGEVALSVRNKMDDLLDPQTDIAIQAITYEGTTRTKFAVEIRAIGGAIPTGTDAIEKVLLKVQVNASAVFSAQTTPNNPNTVEKVTVPGGDNVRSSVYDFELVQMLPTVTPPDDTKPVVKLTPPTEPESDGKLNFGYTITEANPGDDNVVRLPEVSVINGSVHDVDDENSQIIITPVSADAKVTVTVAAGALIDASMNESIEESASFKPEGYIPSITIDGADGTGDDEGKIIFTIDFSEETASFTVADIDVTNTGLLDLTDLKKVTPTTAAPLPDGVAERHTLTVTPSTAADAVVVTIQAGDVMTKNTAAAGQASNSEPFNSAQDSHTLAGAPVLPDIDPTTPSNISKTVFTVPPTVAGKPNSGRLILVRNKTAPIGNYGPATAPTVANLQKSFASILDIDGNRVIPDANIKVWAEMPNLEELFNRSAAGGGGALVLRSSHSTPAADRPAIGTVGISEIMWAIDASYGSERARNLQWIELHNLNDKPKNVLIYAQTGAQFTNADRVVQATQAGDTIHGNPGGMIVDVMTNYFNGSDRGTGGWDVPGSNGSSTTGVNFVSMARQPKRGGFDLKRRHENKADKPLDGLYVKTGGQEQSLDGRASGSWVTSTVTYDSLLTNKLAATVLVPERYSLIGTPGRPNTHAASTHILRDSRTNVPSNTVIINEVANRSDTFKQYEWIELRNVSANEINLRNYLISIVTAKDDGNDKKDRVLYQFPANDNAKIPAGGVFLIVASDPRGDASHPLAVGYNIDLNDEDQAPGTRKNPVLYKVADVNGVPGFGNGRNSGESVTTLPDDGKFVLILRRPDNNEGHRSGADGGKGVAERGKEDLDKIVDVAGYHPNLKQADYSNKVSSTDLWPLRAFRSAGFTLNQFNPDTVHVRQRGAHGLGGVNDGASGIGAHENKNEGGKAAYRDEGYSGIGYKRQASKSNFHGGTPGYHNITKGKIIDLTDKVIISEIMLSQGSGRVKLPQWIELYNPSKTQAVNLTDNAGWRLVIENPGRAPIITINFKSNKHSVKTILPNQTVLIVSSTAKDYGGDGLSRSIVFPNTRVLNAYTVLKGQPFELATRTTRLLGTEDTPNAFNIRLLDGTTANGKPDGRYAGVISDEVGNLDGNLRTNDMPEDNDSVLFEEGVTEDDDRTSIIRIFDAGVARDGMGAVRPLGGVPGTPQRAGSDKGIAEKYSWIHAVDAEKFETERVHVRHTWYGAESDYGTPGDRTGQILPVNLSFFRPTLQDGQVVIRWTTESELDNAGFNILRSETRNGDYKQVNTDLIAGHGTTGERHSYKWVDPTAKPGVVYYYQIEDVSFAGERQTLAVTKLKGLISAKNKLTTTWGELKEVQ